VSAKQRRFFRYAAANPEESGVPKSVSKEFNESDPGGKLPEQAPNTKKKGRLSYSHSRNAAS